MIFQPARARTTRSVRACVRACVRDSWAAAHAALLACADPMQRASASPRLRVSTSRCRPSETSFRRSVGRPALPTYSTTRLSTPAHAVRPPRLASASSARIRVLRSPLPRRMRAAATRSAPRQWCMRRPRCVGSEEEQPHPLPEFEAHMAATAVPVGTWQGDDDGAGGIPRADFSDFEPPCCVGSRCILPFRRCPALASPAIVWTHRTVFV